ncbi:MAG: hypothetical protein KAR47_10070, partial [Planctomycetes bacterium]|nr:hypothetical protein [Planctomycetota bacterium]
RSAGTLVSTIQYDPMNSKGGGKNSVFAMSVKTHNGQLRFFVGDAHEKSNIKIRDAYCDVGR